MKLLVIALLLVSLIAVVGCQAKQAAAPAAAHVAKSPAAAPVK